MMLLITAVMAVQAQVKFSVKYKRVNATTIDIVFTGTAQPGWHIYSTNIGEGGPTRAQFGVDKIKGAKLKGSLKAGPGAKTMQDPIFEMPVTFFEGSATFTQRVELLDKDYELKGYLKYGACNDENCLPPTSVDAKVKGTDGPAPTAETKAEEEKAAQESAQPQAVDTLGNPTAAADTAVVPVQALDSTAVQALWTPVVKELKSFGEDANDVSGKAWYYIFFLGFIGGLIALCTPCVWPIIPMTAEACFNLLDNAVKYGKPGNEIILTVRELGLTIEISVTDQNEPISGEERTRIFERFYRGKNAIEKEGVGIGLYLARQIIEKQGGCLSVCPTGHGNRFSIVLPKQLPDR